MLLVIHILTRQTMSELSFIKIWFSFCFLICEGEHSDAEGVMGTFGGWVIKYWRTIIQCVLTNRRSRLHCLFPLFLKIPLTPHSNVSPADRDSGRLTPLALGCWVKAKWLQFKEVKRAFIHSPFTPHFLGANHTAGFVDKEIKDKGSCRWRAPHIHW